MNRQQIALLMSLSLLLFILILSLFFTSQIRTSNAQAVPCLLRIDGLKKNVGGLSSRYLVTNTSLSIVSTAHLFYDYLSQIPVTFVDSIDAGASKIYSLDSVASLPNGYSGYVIIEADRQITATLLPDPPIAAFTASPTSGLAPLVVTFTNQSTDYTASLWNYGDETTGTLQNPTHTYTTAGVYTVSLTVSGPGGTDTLTRTSYIKVRGKYTLYLPLTLRNR